MDETSPYQAPASAPPPLPDPAALEPAAVKVFGIMHLVLAGIGVLTGLSTLSADKLNGLFTQPGDPNAAAQLRYQEEIQGVTWMTAAFMLLLAGLLVVSGVKLVRSRPDGITWSNRYAWTSIATKLVSLVVAVAYVLPALHRMMGGIIGNAPAMPGKSGETFATVMKIATSAGIVASPLVSCLYPALALYFLSRPRVKEWARLSLKPS